MRSLAVILTSIILGFLTLATYVVEYLGNDAYTEEVSSSFLQYASILTPLIEKDLQDQPDATQAVLSRWTAIIGEETTIQMIDKPQNANKNSYVNTVEITELADVVSIISPLTHPKWQDKALQYEFDDSYSDQYTEFYYTATFAIYLFMAMVITFVAWVIYRYMNKISRVTESVASGKFDLQMPSSRLPALNKLADDINTMASTIEEKTADNLILTGAIHHELRIPITRIRLALDMAVHGNTDEMTAELLTGMDDDLEELSSLMEELLTISRLRLKGVELAKEPLVIQDLIEKVTKDINSPLVTISNSSDFTLQANHTLMERALYNIISNAVKYADNAVVISSCIEANQYVLTVGDDGMGIPEDERDLILKPFYRTDKSRNRNTGGFGLGLAIADMVIKDTHGVIEIGDSELGGAQVSLRWPPKKLSIIKP